ncbi:MAG: class I mannose-6-phosphate isomerase [Muribaculaceae bacterium]|nr:class I mannose-6-phosphate isomerase [Muribaculaceae bacterium]
MIWKFHPLAKRKIWGGGTLQSMYPVLADSVCNEDGPADDEIGEIWLLSGLPGSESVVSEGPDAGMSLSELVSEYGERLLGRSVMSRYGDCFPLLVKFIDAADDLSIQVHPDDGMAICQGLKWGKSEMWYVIGAEEGARLGVGFRCPQNPDYFRTLTDSEDICGSLRYTNVREGDLFYIPAGRIHVLGGGCKVLEIQQSLDVTYRLFDYHRIDADGRERELHTELGHRALNFNDTTGHSIPYDRKRPTALLAATPHFTIIRRALQAGESNVPEIIDSFRIIIALKGSATITDSDIRYKLYPGECVLLSSDSSPVIETTEGFEAVESYIETDIR